MYIFIIIIQSCVVYINKRKYRKYSFGTCNESFRSECMHGQNHWWVRSRYPKLQLCCPTAWPRQSSAACRWWYDRGSPVLTQRRYPNLYYIEQSCSHDRNLHILYSMHAMYITLREIYNYTVLLRLYYMGTTYIMLYIISDPCHAQTRYT